MAKHVSTNKELAHACALLWRTYRNGGSPNEAQRALLRAAYWSNLLPKDRDFNVYQWVEDGFPSP